MNGGEGCEAWDFFTREEFVVCCCRAPFCIVWFGPRPRPPPSFILNEALSFLESVCVKIILV